LKEPSSDPPIVLAEKDPKVSAISTMTGERNGGKKGESAYESLKRIVYVMLTPLAGQEDQLTFIIQDKDCRSYINHLWGRNHQPETNDYLLKREPKGEETKKLKRRKMRDAEPQ